MVSFQPPADECRRRLVCVRTRFRSGEGVRSWTMASDRIQLQFTAEAADVLGSDENCAIVFAHPAEARPIVAAAMPILLGQAEAASGD